MDADEHKTGPEWEEFLHKYRLTAITDALDGWDVLSDSGATYRVTSHTSIDRNTGSMVCTLHCTCAARKRCRHIDAVMDMRYAEELAAARNGDTDGMEIIERTEY